MWLRAPFLLVVLGWIFTMATVADARDVVATNFNAPSVDLTGVIEYLNTPDREIVVPVPGGDGERETAMTVTAKGPGENHHFAAFTLYNEEPLPRDFVLVARWPGYVGSGILWPKFGAAQVLNMQAAPGLQPQRLSQPHADTYALRLSPGETVTYVAELTGAHLPNLTLWQRAAYDKQQQQLSFFRGVVLGIATLTAVFMLCLFVIRMQWAFPAAALFAFASVAFIALEFGYLPTVAAVLPNVAGLEVRIRGVVEALMAAGALACLLTFLDLTRRAPALGYAVLGTFVGSLILAVVAWFSPAVGTGLARILLLITAIGGLAAIIVFWRRGMIRAQASLVSWCFLLLWTICSFAAALGWIDIEMVGPILAWGLVLVLLTMAFTLTQFAFNQGVINSRFFEDSGRRGLALAGAEQIVWDWNEDTGSLFVGPELERVLGHAKGRIDRGGLKGWLELIHPADRGAYVGAIESAVQRGRGTFSQDFRLRRGDGTYRWFQLRARSLPGDLGRAVRCIGTLSDVTGSKRSEEQLLSDAVRDRITGLPNQALFMDRLERAMRRADLAGNGGIYLMLVDLDRFRTVNDSLGFAVGDSLLLTIARRLTSLVGSTDTLARLHGDRFGIILDTEQSGVALEAYLDSLRKLVARPVPLRPQEVFLTASIGVARYLLDKSRPEQLLKDAEIALYEAKRQGKDSLVTFSPEMRNSQPVLLDLEAGLRQALDRNQIEVAYQPVMRLHDRALAGFEALVRWRHEKYGVLEPDAFVKLAEDLGLMNELGRYVLSQAARQLGIWQRAYRSEEPLFVTVNVSSRELINRDLIDEVKTVLSREDLVPGTLKLELTETVLMENPELSVKILQRLQQMGVGIACDDFGTGYSALAHLRRLPFDTIKIDRCFLEGEADDEAAQIILESIVLLAHDLGMDTVVEGIETVDQADRLREIGCDFGQGFLFGEPMSARQVMEVFGGSRSIAAKAGRGARSASLWQRLIKRGEEPEDRGEARREPARVPEARSMPEPARAAPASQLEKGEAAPAEGLLAAQAVDAPVPGEAERQPTQPVSAAAPQLAAAAQQPAAKLSAAATGAGVPPAGPPASGPGPSRTVPAGMPVRPGMPPVRPAAVPPAGTNGGAPPGRQTAAAQTPMATGTGIRPDVTPAAAAPRFGAAVAPPAAGQGPAAAGPVESPLRRLGGPLPPTGQPSIGVGSSRSESGRHKIMTAIDLSGPTQPAPEHAGARDQRRAGFAIGLREQPIDPASRTGDHRAREASPEAAGGSPPPADAAQPGPSGAAVPERPTAAPPPAPVQPAARPAAALSSREPSTGASPQRPVPPVPPSPPAIAPPAPTRLNAAAGGGEVGQDSSTKSDQPEQGPPKTARAAEPKTEAAAGSKAEPAEVEQRAVPGEQSLGRESEPTTSTGKGAAAKPAKKSEPEAAAQLAEAASAPVPSAAGDQQTDSTSDGAAKKRSRSRAATGPSLDEGEPVPGSSAEPAAPNDKAPRDKTQGDRSRSGKSQGDKPQSDKSQGDKPKGETSLSDKKDDKAEGDKPSSVSVSDVPTPAAPAPAAADVDGAGDGQRGAMMAKAIGELRAVGEQPAQQQISVVSEEPAPASQAATSPDPEQSDIAQNDDAPERKPAPAKEQAAESDADRAQSGRQQREALSAAARSLDNAAEPVSTASAPNTQAQASAKSQAKAAEEAAAPPEGRPDATPPPISKLVDQAAVAAVVTVAETVAGVAKAVQSAARSKEGAGTSSGSAGVADSTPLVGIKQAAPQNKPAETDGQEGQPVPSPTAELSSPPPPPPPPPARRAAATEGTAEKLVAEPPGESNAMANGPVAGAPLRDRPPPPLKRLLRRQKPPAKPPS
ncbi:EAL domain-containing protein [Rhodoligotrophos defluvii]|uniref:EAL domain-containing protein n=1 Tax=Rhodoligotrophos defluvii TaxID=2561934 RepID=UPI0014853FD9|nr:EAL domain-containing protein [Rhodoligotrophos defluvii]